MFYAACRSDTHSEGPGCQPLGLDLLAGRISSVADSIHYHPWWIFGGRVYGGPWCYSFLVLLNPCVMNGVGTLQVSWKLSLCFDALTYLRHCHRFHLPHHRTKRLDFGHAPPGGGVEHTDERGASLR